MLWEFKGMKSKNHNKSITKPKLGYLSRDILKNF